MDEVQTFLRCYRIAVRDYQLPPKDSARVLVGVLRRIGCPCPAGHPRCPRSTRPAPRKGG